jgi:peptide/nickel transport system substrate-binding protein
MTAHRMPAAAHEGTEHSSKGTAMKRLKVIGVIIAAGLLAAACGTSSSPGKSSSHTTASGVLTIDNESGGTWTCDFNPFNLSYISYSLGPVYEPLMFVNTLQSAKVTPWLATAYAWSNGNKTLTFTIRNGVKFTNGTPLTAADVVYTFNLLKAHKTLDINSVWSVLTSVTQKGSNQVVMTFNAPAVTYFYYIADQIGIVSQKIWSKIANPVTFPDKNPVGTGPYTVSSSTCTPQNIKYTANPHYWQPGLPKVAVVNYPAFLTNDTANTYLANGQAQWGSQFIPSIQKFYLSRNPDYHYWFPPVANVSMFINLTNPILKNVAVRQAMAYAINRQKASAIGEYGYEPASNQAGIVTPTFSSWLDTSQAAAYGNNYAYNPAKAISILEKAGFKRGSNGIFQTPSGQPLSFTIVNNGGFSDWVAAVQTIQQSLKAVGIQVTPENLADTTYQTDLYSGKFQLGYGAETGGPTPYFELRQWLYGPNSAPIGTTAGSNFERYDNPAVNKLINEYPATTSAATQHSIVDQLQKVMLQDVPVIPVTEAVDWFQYDTGSFSGWPTPGNPYAQPAAYDYPDWAQVMLHLTPVK